MSRERLLFDTNAFIAWAKEDRALAAKVASIGRPILSLISLGELVLGARRSARPEKNLRELEGRLRDFELLLADRETAYRYGDVTVALRRMGKPIPANDAWIAALALQHGLAVLTRDAHFREVEHLSLVDW